MSGLFIQPSYEKIKALLNNSNSNSFNGIFTLGKIENTCKSVKGKISLQHNALYFIAEYDIDELETLQKSMSSLNESLAQTQKKLAQVNQSLESRIKERTQDLEEALKQSIQTRRELSLSIQDKNDILNSVVDGIISIEENGTILSFNTGAEKLFGYQALEVINKNIKILMPDKYSEHHDQYIQNYLTTGIQKIIGIGRDVSAKRKDGTEFPMHLSVAEMGHKEFSKRRFIGSCVDLTEIHQQQDLLRRSQKMDALGMLTGGISHDFNNILGVILGFSELIKEVSPPNSKIAEYAENISHSGQRGATLTKKLLAFSRNKLSDKSLVNINKIIVDTQNVLEKTLTPRIKIIYQLDTQLWEAWLDKNDFEDALINICINAMHAIDGSGIVTIKTLNTIVTTQDANLFEIDPGSYIMLSIADTGQGMDKNTLEKIFDPFFTTKGEKGTGLGLSQVFGFIKRCNGAINIESKISKGTTVNLYFPQSKNYDNDKQPTRTNNSENLSGTETLLLVDDEETMLNLYHTLLTSNGYKVFSASSPEQAIKLLKNETIDLLLSDVIMPNINGYELAEIVKKEYPQIKIQLMSGYEDNVLIKNEVYELHKHIILKPFPLNVLLKRLREILDV